MEDLLRSSLLKGILKIRLNIIYEERFCDDKTREEKKERERER